MLTFARGALALVLSFSLLIAGPAQAGFVQLIGAGYTNAPPPGGPPVNTVAPAISGMNAGGTADITQPLACSTGTWTGAPTITYAYKYQRNGVDIGGATTANYTPTVADTQIGTVLTCIVTATNGISSVPATSNSVTAFHPYQIATVFWDFEDTSKGTFGATATAWISGGLAATPITAAEVTGSGPTYSATSFNGRPGVTGNGSTMYLEALSTTQGGSQDLTSLQIGSTANEMYAFLNQPDAGAVVTTRAIFGYGNAATSSVRGRIIYKVSVSTVSTLRGEAGTGAGQITSDNGPFLNRNLVHVIYGTNTVNAELNGVAGSTPAATTLNALAARLRILSTPTNTATVPQSFSTTTINGVGVFPTLTAGQRNSMTYFGNARAALP